MRKRFSLILVLALALGLLCVFLSAEAETETRVFQLGTSIYTIEIPVSFVEGEKTEEGISQGMVAYMHSDVGGWAPAADPTITDEIKALLDKATEGLDGVAYDPITYLGSQVVAGTNHAILCKATVLNLNAIPTWKIVYIYEDLQGNVSVMNIADFDVGSLCTYGAK